MVSIDLDYHVVHALPYKDIGIDYDERISLYSREWKSLRKEVNKIA